MKPQTNFDHFMTALTFALFVFVVIYSPVIFAVIQSK